MVGIGMDSSDAVGELIEQGQQATTNTTKNVVSDVKSSISDQLGFKTKNTNGQISPQGQPQDQESQQADQSSEEDNQRNKDMVSDFYSPTSDTPVDISAQQDELQTKQKLVELRKKLHDEVYYEPLINSQKPQEERPAERVERQEKEEMQDLQQSKDQKPDDSSLRRAQTAVETSRGVSG